MWSLDGPSGEAPVMVVGGNFNIAGTVVANAIALWNGSSWKLFDWMAAEFVSIAWDQTGWLMTMVLSSTYRQKSLVSPELLAPDSNNTALSRGQRYRLSA